MGVTVKLVQEYRHTRPDGMQAVKLRVTIDRTVIEWSLGYAIPPAYWDEKTQSVKAHCPQVENVTRLNHFLQKEKSRAFSRIVELNESGQLERLSRKETIARIRDVSRDVKMLEYGRDHIHQLQQAGRHGNARVYDTMLRSITSFVKGKDFALKQINFAWLTRYENWYLARGNSLNGLSVNLRSLRALMNRAIKEKRLSRDHYPFDDYKTRIKIKNTGVGSSILWNATSTINRTLLPCL